MSNFKKTIENLKKLKGEVRGSCSQGMISYLKDIKKENYFSQIEGILKEYGFEEKLEKIDPLKWYPIAFEVALLFSIKETLSWNEENIKELGKNTVKLSFIFRLLMKYFISLERSCREAPNYWKKHFNFGGVEIPKFSEKEKYCIIRIKDFNLHPLYCKFLEGYFESLIFSTVQAKKFLSEETKCMSKGDSFHEFIIKWE